MNEIEDAVRTQSEAGDGTDRASARGPHPEVLRLLRTLAAHCRDSEAGYRLAYENAAERSLRVEFGRLVDEREEMARQLDAVFRQLGEEPPARGTTLGVAHRIFLGLKAAIAGRDRDEIIEEIVRGESVFEANFDALLRRDLPSAVEATIVEQHRSVRATRDHFRAQLPASGRPSARSTASAFTEMVEKHPTLSCAVVAAAATGFAAAMWLMRQPDRRRARSW